MKYSWIILALLIIFGCRDEPRMPCLAEATHNLSDTIVYALDEVDQSAFFDETCCDNDDESLFDCSYKSYALAILQDVKYPAYAREHGIEGRVIVSFVIEKDGSLSGFNIEEGIGGGCDEEVVRVLEEGPTWQPAIHNGYYVRMRAELTVSFKLQ